MKYKIVKNIIFNELETFLKGHGFLAKKAEELFRKSTNDGFQEIAIAISNYDPIFQIDYIFGIRVDEVEEIINTYENTPDEYKDLSLTSMVSMARLKGKGSMPMYEISDEKELYSSLADFITFLKTDGLLHFTNFNSIQSLDGVISGNLEKTSLHMIDISNRISHGLVLAKLNQNPNFESFVAKYRQFHVENEFNDDLEVFDNLTNYLREI